MEHTGFHDKEHHSPDCPKCVDEQEVLSETKRFHSSKEVIDYLHSPMSKPTLVKYNFNECLYLDSEGKKTKKCLPPGDALGCRVCPSERKWWEEELLDLPSGGEKDATNNNVR